MGRTGLEPDDATTCSFNGLRKTVQSGGAESGAVSTAPVLSDSSLQIVVAGWAKLPEAIKSGILAMVKTVAKKA
jgi:hypothetical protein